MAISAGVCDAVYGERLLAIIQKAIGVLPYSPLDTSHIEADAEKARSDKKNSDDGRIKMSVAKAKNEWTMFALPFEEYKAALLKAAH